MRKVLLPMIVVPLLVAAGCGGAGAPADSTGAPPTTNTDRHAAAPTGPDDWPTYHRDNTRTGFVPDFPTPANPAVAWRADLDGAVYGQPLVVGDRLLVATENDTLYALDPATGAVRWSSHVGTPVAKSTLPCGNIDPLGMTGTPVYDPATSRVFAVAETTGGRHELVGANVDTGRIEVRVPVEPPRGDRNVHQQRAALTLLNDRVHVAYGGLNGDCGEYFGTVFSVSTAGTDPRTYTVPTSREAGIWTPGGAVVDGDKLLYSVGNGESTSGFDDSDAVTALDANLRRVDLFAPTTWAADNEKDLDLGSGSPTLLGPWVFVAGKSGTGYVLDRNRLGGIGAQRGQGPVCKSFGGTSVAGDTAYLPCVDGPRALTIGPNGTPDVRWKAAVPANGSPVVGGDTVWVPDWHGGVLYALDRATGAVRAQVPVGDLPHFASPTLSGRRVYLGTMRGVVAVDAAR
jgi:polyvinyl alcohol dehydrogenase (cytochrome)